MKTAAEYRLQAHESCRPNIGKLALTFLVYDILVSLCSGTVIGIILVGPLYLGFVQAIQDNLDNKEVKVESLFSNFNSVGKTFLLGLVEGIYIYLWSFLFVIPGIIKSFSYSMAYYIHKDDRELSVTECITRSRKMMDGNKWRLFCLEFSYIGWVLLSLLTFGILLFWVVPRMETAKYQFYLDLKGKEENKEVVAE